MTCKIFCRLCLFHPLATDNEVDFFLSLPRFAAEADAQTFTFDLNTAEYYRDIANDYGQIVFAIYLALSPTSITCSSSSSTSVSNIDSDICQDERGEGVKQT